MTNESLINHLNEQGLTADAGQVAVADYSVSFQVNPRNTLFVVNHPASAVLLIAPESDYTQSADQLGVSEESKIGHSDFDDRYVIRDPEGRAGSVLKPEVISAVQALEPFVELELNSKQYRLLKEGLDEKQALETIRALQQLVKLTS
ncbi:MAG: hypothetical protein WC423_02105 [Vulcanimicrobiota bacterium]